MNISFFIKSPGGNFAPTLSDRRQMVAPPAWRIWRQQQQQLQPTTTLTPARGSCQNGGHIENQSSISKPVGGATDAHAEVRARRQVCGAAMPDAETRMLHVACGMWGASRSHAHRTAEEDELRKVFRAPGPGSRSGRRSGSNSNSKSNWCTGVGALSQVTVVVLVAFCSSVGAIFETTQFEIVFEFGSKPDLNSVSIWVQNWFG